MADPDGPLKLSAEPLLSAAAIQERIEELAAQINADYAGAEEIVLLVVLKGAVVFAADLGRRLTMPLRWEFVRAKSYQGAQSTGHVDYRRITDPELQGRHVLVVEDILDTGRTTQKLRSRLEEENPASVALCTLLDKPGQRLVPAAAEYVGFTIGPKFVVGYGLDHDERYRELPAVYTLVG